MTSPILTIGMAHWDDMTGAMSTIESIRSSLGPELVDQVHFMVIDNSSEHATRAANNLQVFLANMEGTYISAPEVKGTSEPRDRIFRHSKTPYTMCVDCHIIPLQGAIQAVLKYFKENPDTKNIVQGPFCNDRIWHKGELQTVGTHMDDRWRGNMHGTWGAVWQCPCGKQTFSVIDQQAQCRYIKLKMRPYGGDFENVEEHCDECGTTLKKIAHSAHERRLKEWGYKIWVNWSQGPDSLVVPAMGLGTFACKTEHWVGMAKGCKGFGGEEINLHKMFAKNGGKCICLKNFVAWHRFYKDRVTYAARIRDMIRNQLKWHALTGDGNEEMFECYTQRIPQLLTEEEFRRVLDTPDDYETDKVVLTTEPKPQVQVLDRPPTPKHGRPQPPDPTNIESSFNWFVKAPEARRDLNEHMPFLREVASKCKYVTEFSYRRESRIALLLGYPQEFWSYNFEEDEINDTLRYWWRSSNTVVPHNYHFTNKEEFQDGKKFGSLITDIDPRTEFLFLDTHPSYETFYKELSKYGKIARRFIARHDTEFWGEKCPNDPEDAPKKGLVQAMKDFLAENPEWFVVYHNQNQFGLTLLGCQEQDRPVRPVWAWNPDYGPGTELKSLLASLGFTTTPKCDCARKADIMDRWGIEACKENQAMIEKWMMEGKRAWKWDDENGSLSIAVKAAASREGWQIAKRMLATGKNEVEVLVEMAIQRAEAKQAQKDQKTLEVAQ